MASLALVSLTVNTGGTIDLTGLGADDWAVWMSGDAAGTPSQRKSGGSSTLGALGSAASSGYTNDPNTYAWSDGTPAGTNTGETEGVYTNILTLGGSQSSTWPASTATRRAWFYGSYYQDPGFTALGPKILAHLSDSSAADVSDITTLPYANGSVICFVAIFDYAAGSAGQTLTISQVSQINASGFNNHDWNAAAVKVLAASSSADFSSAGSAGVNGSGASKVAGVIGESSTATVTGSGASIASAAGSISAVASITGVGAARVAGVVSEFGAATATGLGASIASGVVSELGSVVVLGISGSGGTSPADGLISATSSVQGVGGSIVSAAGSISASASVAGAAAAIVASAGQISSTAVAKGSSLRTTVRRFDGPGPRHRMIRQAEETELLELAALLVPLVSKGGPLWVR